MVKAFLVVTIAALTFNALTTPPRTTTAPSGHDIEAAGARVHYDAWGEHGPASVLVHGFFESTVSWEAAARELARHHRVYAVDLAGSGYSEASGRYSMEDQTALVSGFITTMKLGRATLVGHALGASVVGVIALHHPEQVDTVIFTDGDGLPFRGGGSGGTMRSVMSLVMRTPYATSLYRLGTRWG